MSKSKKSKDTAIAPEGQYTNPEMDGTNDVPTTDAQPTDAPVAETAPKAEEKENIELPLETDTDEVKAIKGAIAEIRSRIATINTTLKAERKLLNENLGNLRFILKGEQPKTGKKYVFMPVEAGASETMKMINGKPLSYQGKLIVKIFNETITEPTGYSKEEILEKLTMAGYPCVGDVFDNFSWYKTQVLKLMKLVD
jgi:hypothetical protein